MHRLTKEDERDVNNALVYCQVLNSFPTNVVDFEKKKKKSKKKKSSTFKNGCLAATRLYSLRDEYKSVTIALDMTRYKSFERKFHGEKIVPRDGDKIVLGDDGDPVTTFVIDQLCEKEWRGNFCEMNQRFLRRPPMI